VPQAAPPLPPLPPPPPPSSLAPLPPQPAAPAAPPLRYSYRNPQTAAVAGPFRVSAFADWVATGAISTAEADALRVWRQGAPESSSVPLREALAAAAAGGGGQGGAA
jgi:hypothetical protein